MMLFDRACTLLFSWWLALLSFSDLKDGMWLVDSDDCRVVFGAITSIAFLNLFAC